MKLCLTPWTVNHPRPFVLFWSFSSFWSFWLVSSVIFSFSYLFSLIILKSVARPPIFSWWTCPVLIFWFSRSISSTSASSYSIVRGRQRGISVWVSANSCVSLKFSVVMSAWRRCWWSVWKGREQAMFVAPLIDPSRYIAIVHPMKSSSTRRHQRLVVIFIIIWSVAILMASPNLFLLTLHPHYSRLNSHVCGLSDHYTHSSLILAYKYLESICFYFIPIFLQVSNAFSRLASVIVVCREERTFSQLPVDWLAWMYSVLNVTNLRREAKIHKKLLSCSNMWFSMHLIR